MERKRMDNFRKECEEMIEAQLIRRGINNLIVIEAMRKVPRHLFVSSSLWSEAYEDHPLPIGEGQTISQPYIVALMTQLLDLKGKEKVLEIGTGSGYQTAILAELAKEVYSIERIEILAIRAERKLQELGYKNVFLFSRDGSLGLNEYAPYDCIIVTAATPGIPIPLFKQLNEGGKMVIPKGEVSFSQTLMLVEKKNEKMKQTPICGCVFVPLIGKYGWDSG